MDFNLVSSLLVGVGTLLAILLATYYVSDQGLEQFSVFDVLENRAMPVLLAIFYGILLLLLGIVILVLTVILLELLLLLLALCVGLTVEFVNELSASGAFSTASKCWYLLGLYLGCCFAWPIFIFSAKRTWRGLVRIAQKFRGNGTAAKNA
jgi:hypothetical protein